MANPTSERWAQARLEWESDAALTHEALAASLGVSRQAVSKRAFKEGWRRIPSSRLRTVNEAAHEAADALSDPGLPVAPGNPVADSVAAMGLKVAGATPPDAPPDAATEAAAVAKRTAVIQRHRDAAVAGWARLQSALRAHNSARSLPQKKLAFEDLKAAKITSETIQILQRVEREAWGLDTVAEAETYVIERSYGHTV
jgi:hypothetical protein